MELPPESGRLEETPLPRLLFSLYRAHFTGRLRLFRDRISKTFQLREGVPIFAESNLASECLGVQLMDAGRISRADYGEVSRHVEKRGVKEGVALLELKLLEPKELFLALKEQLRTRMVECFGWAQGEYEFEETDAPPEAAQPFRADVYSLIQEGIETHWSADRILADLGSKMSGYPVRTSRLSRIQHRLRWDDSIESFLDTFDGKHTLWKALQLAKTPRALAAAWMLDAAGAVTYQDTAVSTEEPDEGALPELEIVFGEEAQKPDAEARPKASEAASRAGSPESEKLRREISAKFERLDELDHYEILDLKPDAPAGDVKISYLKAAKRYHPDALARAGLDDEAREEANKVFAEIGRAYAVLSDPDRRRDYDARGDDGDATFDADQIANAERLFRKGEILLRTGNFRGALEYLQPAVELWPEEAAYQSALGWALYKKMPSEPEQAKAHLEAAASLASDDPIVIFRLSVVLRTLGETVAASALAEKARAIDPNVG